MGLYILGNRSSCSFTDSATRHSTVSSGSVRSFRRMARPVGWSMRAARSVCMRATCDCTMCAYVERVQYQCKYLWHGIISMWWIVINVLNCHMNDIKMHLWCTRLLFLQVERGAQSDHVHLYIYCTPQRPGAAMRACAQRLASQRA